MMPLWSFFSDDCRTDESQPVAKDRGHVWPKRATQDLSIYLFLTWGLVELSNSSRLLLSKIIECHNNTVQ